MMTIAEKKKECFETMDKMDAGIHKLNFEIDRLESQLATLKARKARKQRIKSGKQTLLRFIDENSDMFREELWND